MNIFCRTPCSLTIWSLSSNGCLCLHTVPSLNNEETAQIILGHSMYHNAKSLSKCSLQETSPINYFYIHAFNLLFSVEEICFKLPSLFRLRVAWNYSRNFHIRLPYRDHGRFDVKMWSELKYLFRCNLSKRHVITVHLGKGLLHGSPL